MKPLFRFGILSITLLCFLLLATTQSARAQATKTEKSIRQKWALVVGVSKFANGIQNLKYAAKDAQDFAQYLVKKAGFPKDHVKLLIDDQASTETIFREFGRDWLPRVVTADDLVVIYLSSAGSPSSMDLEKVNYLSSYNTEPDSLYTTGIQAQNLWHTVASRIPTKRIIIILDSSYSGGAVEAPSNLYDSRFAKDQFAVLCSSTSTQKSWESKKCENSVFTRQLITTLHKLGSRASLGEVFSQTRAKVQAEVKFDRNVEQTPTATFANEGDQVRLAGPRTKVR